MITQIKEGYDYIHIAVAIVDSDGKVVDPSSAEALFYKVSQEDGSLSLDTNINGDGKVTLAKQGGQTGFYGSAIATDSLSANEYVILYKVTIGSIESITVEFFSIDLSKKVIHEIKPETDKIQPMSIKIRDIKDETDEIPTLVINTNKIQAEIIDKPDDFKADVSSLADIKTETDKISSLKTMVELIEGVEIGEWEISSDVLYFKDPSGQITIAAFQLHFDKKGNVIRRERIS